MSPRWRLRLLENLKQSSKKELCKALKGLIRFLPAQRLILSIWFHAAAISFL